MNIGKMERLGTKYGGWYVPTFMDLNDNSIVYSGGVGEDISFDLWIQHKYNCNILLIDPTEKAIKHYNEAQLYYNNLTKFTGGIQPDYYSCIQSLHPLFDKIQYLNLGIWNKPDDLKFYKQSNDNYVSQSLVANMFGKNYDIVKVDTIKNIMDMHGHSHIDLLKLDIEGAEVEVMNKMLDDKIYPKYVLIEFDLLLKKKDPENKTCELIDRMVKIENYNILKNDNLNVTFVH
jgi:FkbM family methyltransferase